MVNTDGPLAAKYRKPGSTEELPASELFMYAFKFKGTTNVGFNCAVKICKKGEGSFCKPVSVNFYGILLQNDISVNCKCFRINTMS